MKNKAQKKKKKEVKQDRFQILLSEMAELKKIVADIYNRHATTIKIETLNIKADSAYTAGNNLIFQNCEGLGIRSRL